MPIETDSDRIDRRKPIVTLLTDFGYTDTFAGVMKGVIKRICPDAEIVDLTHGIPSQDVFAGAIAWQSAYRHFSAGTIHVGVVDPGVGSERRAIAVQAGGSMFLCPDNGLISFVASEVEVGQIVEIKNESFLLPTLSRTFHGRDVFAPAAAHLAAGVDIKELGPRVEDVVGLRQTEPIVDGDCVWAHVVYFDGFGNAYTDLTEEAFRTRRRGPVNVSVHGESIIGPLDAYAGAAVGMPLALFAAHGRLEIAVRNGNARTVLGLNIGDAIRIDCG